jgi:hypothetical protein
MQYCLYFFKQVQPPKKSAEDFCEKQKFSEELAKTVNGLEPLQVLFFINLKFILSSNRYLQMTNPLCECVWLINFAFQDLHSAEWQGGC